MPIILGNFNFALSRLWKGFGWVKTLSCPWTLLCSHCHYSLAIVLLQNWKGLLEKPCPHPGPKAWRRKAWGRGSSQPYCSTKSLQQQVKKKKKRKKQHPWIKEIRVRFYFMCIMTTHGNRPLTPPHTPLNLDFNLHPGLSEWGRGINSSCQNGKTRVELAEHPAIPEQSKRKAAIQSSWGVCGSGEFKLTNGSKKDGGRKSWLCEGICWRGMEYAR